MYRLHDTVTSDESQATQIMLAALRRSPSTAHSQESSLVLAVESKNNTSASPGIVTSAHEYRLWGLAETQTPRHSSRSTNPEQSLSGSDLPTRFTERQQSREKDVRGEVAQDGTLDKQLVPADTLVAGPSRFQDSPARSTSRYASRPQQSALRRQDSFAEPLPTMDQVNAFMRDSTLFSKPISKLGVDTQAKDDSLHDTSLHSQSTQLSTQPPGLTPPLRSSYFVPDSDHSQDTRSQRHRASQSPHPEYTQSLDFEQAQAQDSGDDFRTAAFGTQQSDQDDSLPEPTDSYQYEATQLDPTQPTSDHEPTQQDLDSIQFGSENGGLAKVFSHYTVNSHATPAPGILSMVNPAKKWRLRAFAARHENVGTQSLDQTVPETTQDHPMFDTQMDEPGLSSEPTQPAYQVNSPKRLLTRGTSLKRSIVPDSEPHPAHPQASHAIPLIPSEDWRASVPCEDGPDSFLADSLFPESVPAPKQPQPKPPPAPEPETWQSSEPCDIDIPGLVFPPMVDNPRRSPVISRKEVKGLTEDEEDAVEESVLVHAPVQEEEESEEDIPLAAVQPERPKAQRRGSAAQMPPPKVLSNRKGRQHGKSNPDVSSDTVVVPSSNPLQDFPKARKPHTISQPGPSNISRTAPASRRSTRSQTPMTKSPSSSPLSSENDTAVSAQELPSALDKWDRDTEPADEDYMDLEPSENVPVSRKRKRAATSTTVSKSSKRSRAMSTTPLPTKKIKMSSSTSRSGMIGATRVFALWKSNAQYYSGVVYSQADGADPRYLIRFDDDTEDTVDLPNIRQCILYEGDGVFLNQYNCKGRVTEVSGESLTVQARNKEPYRLTVSDIRIAAATVRNDWNDRKLTVDQIIPAVRPKYLVETPSKNSLASAGTAVSGSKQKMLSGVGLVVTLSPNNVEWEARKSEVMTAIKSKGGVVLEDWSDIFHLEGKVELSGRRWVARKEDVTLRRNFENVFLISDAYHQKPKYLIALALGIPCISAEWLVNENTDPATWQWYLLPAGFSTQLHYRMSQLVNLDWGDEDRHLDRIMHNTAPPKIFMDLSILYVSTDFVAQVKNGRKAKTDAMLAQEANRTIPRILLCMGAKRVEAVASATDASQKPQKFDYVVVKEPHEVAQFSTKGTTCVHFKWVKDCLFSGRLLPHDFDYSA